MQDNKFIDAIVSGVFDSICKAAKVPDDAVDFLNFMKDVSQDISDFSFSVGDDFIVEKMQKSPATINRKRRALTEWQKKEDKGYLDMKRKGNKPIEYNFRLLNVIKSLVQKTMIQTNISAQHMFEVSARSNSLLEGGETMNALQKRSDPSLFLEVQTFNSGLREALDAMQKAKMIPSGQTLGAQRHILREGYKGQKAIIERAISDGTKPTETIEEIINEIDASLKTLSHPKIYPDEIDKLSEEIKSVKQKVARIPSKQRCYLKAASEALKEAIRNPTNNELDNNNFIRYVQTLVELAYSDVNRFDEIKREAEAILEAVNVWESSQTKK